jgi:hypothetical protein
MEPMPPVRGELPALLALLVFALPGSELDGVGWSNNAERLALFAFVTVPLASSEWELRGGEVDRARFGGVWVAMIDGGTAPETALIPGSGP